MRRFLLACILLVAASLPAQDSKPDAQVGNFLFKMPNGWNPQAKGDMTFLYAPSPPPGTLTYIALAAHDLDTDLEKSFNELWTGYNNANKVLQGGQITPLHAKNGYDAYYATAIASDQNGTRWHVFILGALYKNRLQAVIFASNVPSPQMYGAYEKVFQTFLGSLSFGDALPGAVAVPGPANGPGSPAPTDDADKPHTLPPGMIEGVYVAFTLSATGGVSLRRLHFNPDGWVVKDVPQEGMIGFDFTAYRNDRNTNRSWVGRYRVDGNNINIVWQDYAEHRELLKRNETSGKPALDVFIPMCRCTGKKFSGKYNWGLAGSDQYLQFFPDGTFIDHKVTDQMLVPSAFYEHPRILRGTYQIQSQTLIFYFSDGRRGMRTFIAPKAQENQGIFDWIGLGWQTLYEEHHQNEP